jgi:hypothetical protein
LTERVLKVPLLAFDHLAEVQRTLRQNWPAFVQDYLEQGPRYPRRILQRNNQPRNKKKLRHKLSKRQS